MGLFSVLNGENSRGGENDLVCFIVSIFVRIARNIARIVRYIFSSGNAFAFSSFIETLLMRTRIL